MRSRRGNLGFGALSSGPISGPHTTPEPPPWDGNTAAIKLAGGVLAQTADTAAIKLVGGAVAETAGSAALKIAGSALLENAPTAAIKIAGAAILDRSLLVTLVYKIAGAIVYDGIEPIVRPKRYRVPVGMAEYTNTTGIAPYLVLGALPGFATLRSQLTNRQHVGYRTTGGTIHEVGEGIFDWPANELIRVRAIIPDAMIDWVEGRKLIHIIEDGRFSAAGTVPAKTTGLSIGIGEYTTTTGTGPYELRGAMPEFASLLSTLTDRTRVQYRVTNGAMQEFGDGIFDALRNRVIRNMPTAPAVLVDWGPGRKLIYITEI